MSNYQSARAPAEVTTTRSGPNARLWIILGSITGVLVILVGGCLACGALIVLTALNEERRSTSPTKNAGRQEGGTLSSTSWNGTLNCDDGDNLPVVIKFAANGNPLYDYQTSTGLKEVEFISSGQTLRFVPPGGGVTNIVLDSIAMSSNRMSYSMTISRERSGGGTLIQSRAEISTEAVVSDSTLDLKTTIRSRSAASQPGYVIPDESVTVCRGSLRS